MAIPPIILGIATTYFSKRYPKTPPKKKNKNWKKPKEIIYFILLSLLTLGFRPILNVTPNASIAKAIPIIIKCLKSIFSLLLEIYFYIIVLTITFTYELYYLIIKI